MYIEKKPRILSFDKCNAKQLDKHSNINENTPSFNDTALKATSVPQKNRNALRGCESFLELVEICREV